MKAQRAVSEKRKPRQYSVLLKRRHGVLAPLIRKEGRSRAEKETVPIA